MYFQALILASIFVYSDQSLNLWWNNEAEVVLSHARSQKLDMKVFKDSQCKTPRKNDKIYVHCSPFEASKYPAHEAQCLCAKCALKFELTCNEDEKWYSNLDNPCDPDNARYRCGVCKYSQIIKDYRCEVSSDGYLNEKRTCHCRNSCLKHYLTCYRDGWKHEETSGCGLPNSAVHHHEPTMHLQWTFYNGEYNYMCEPGYKLHGPHTKTCRNGLISNEEISLCVQVDEVTPQADTTKSDNSTRGLVIAVIVIMLALAVFLLIYLIRAKLYRRCGARKMLPVPACAEYIADNEAVYETVGNDEYSVAYYAVSQRSDHPTNTD